MDPLILKPNLKLKWTGIPIVWGRGDPVQLLVLDVAAVHAVFFAHRVCMLTCRSSTPNLAPDHAKSTLLSKKLNGLPLATRCVLRSAGNRLLSKVQIEPWARVYKSSSVSHIRSKKYIYIYIYMIPARDPKQFFGGDQKGIWWRRNHIIEEKSWRRNHGGRIMAGPSPSSQVGPK